MSGYKFKKSDEIIGTIIGVIFGGALFVGGLLFAFYQVIPTITAAYEARKYVPVDAVVIKAELQSVSDNGRSISRVATLYEYSINGKQYSSDRIGLVDQKETRSEWQVNWYSILSQARKSNKTITVYVNPDNPFQAVVDKTLRKDAFGVAIAAMFCLCGFGSFVIYRMLTVRLGNDASVSGKDNVYPDLKIYSEESKDIPMKWSLAFFYNLSGITAAIIYVSVAPYEVNPLTLFILWVVFNGSAIIIAVLREEKGLRKLGRAPLIIHKSPLRMGDEIVGSIELGMPLREGHIIETTLFYMPNEDDASPMESRVDGSRIEWQKSISTITVPLPKGSIISIDFNLPKELPTIDKLSNSHWVLHLSVKTPDEALKCEYEFSVLPA